MRQVYHGGTHIIEHPRSDLGRKHLDFGEGFYVTDLKNQAEQWAQIVALKRNDQPVLNIYSFDNQIVEGKFNFLKFPSYNKEWLDFVCSNRRGNDLWKDYDIIEGGVADDRVAVTVELYYNGYISHEDALRRLAYLKLNNQICIINQEIIDNYLVFISSQSL